MVNHLLGIKKLKIFLLFISLFSFNLYATCTTSSSICSERGETTNLVYSSVTDACYATLDDCLVGEDGGGGSGGGEELPPPDDGGGELPPPPSGNTPPQLTSKLIEMGTNYTYTFAFADFGYSDAEGQEATGLYCDFENTEVGDGTLFIDANGDGIADAGEEITINSNLSVATNYLQAVKDGKFKFEPKQVTSANPTYVFRIRASDGTDYDTSEVSLSISYTYTERNYAPADINISVASIDENQASNTLIGTFATTDANSADTHKYSLCGGADDNNFTVDEALGTLRAKSGFNYEEKSSYTICIRSTEDTTDAFSKDKEIVITINDVNEAPTISGEADTEVNTGELYSFTPTGEDPDANAQLTYSIINKPLWANFNATTGELSGTPTQTHVGTTQNITITVKDNGNLSASLSSFSIEVKAAQLAPNFLTSFDTIQMQEDNGTTNYELNITDINGDAITLSIESNDTSILTVTPNWKNSELSQGEYQDKTLDFNLTTVENAYGTVKITITASDATDRNTTMSFNVEVESVNDAPVITSADNKTVTVDELLNHILSATDVEGDAVSWSVSGLPSGVSLIRNELNTLVGSKLKHPSGVVVDSNGVVYIADTGNNAIKQYKDGNLTTLLALNSGPRGIAVDSNGVVYFTDSSTLKQYKDGKLDTLTSYLNYPSGIAVDSNGVVYIADTQNRAIKQYKEGKLTELNFPNLKYPVGIAVDSNGVVYHADSSTLIQYKDGNLTTLSVPGLYAYSRAVDSDGVVYFTDSSTLKQYKEGKLDTLVDSNLSYPSGVAVDSNGVVYIADTGNNAIKTYSPHLKLSGTIATANTYTITLTASDGDLNTTQEFTLTVSPPANAAPTDITLQTYTVEENATVIGTLTSTDRAGDTHSYLLCGGDDEKYFDINGSLLIVKAGSSLDYETRSEYNYEYKVCVRSTDTTDGNSDNLYFDKNITIAVTDVNEAPVITSVANKTVTVDELLNHTLTATDPEGDDINWSVKGGTTLPGGITLSNAGMIDLITTGLSSPGGVAVDGNGNIYVVDSGNGAVKKYDSNGSLHATISGPYSPDGVAVDGNGNIYVTDSSYHTVKKYDSNGSLHATIGGFFNLSGVAVDGIGNIYVADTGNNAVKKYDSNNSLDATISGLSSPVDVAVDGNGNIYVTDYNGGAVKKYDSNGSLHATISGFFNLSGVAIDGSGNVYVADSGISAVKKYDSNGSLHATISGFFDISGVAVDGNGNIYGTDYNIGAVKKYSQNASLNGTATTAGPSTITLVATDAKGASSEHTFMLTVNPPANAAPTDITLQTYTVEENATVIGTLTSTDRAGDTHTYSICESDDENYFDISASSLIVKAGQSLDYETKQEYKVCVRSTDTTDDNRDNLYFDKNITIAVTDVNEAPVITSVANKTVTVDELLNHTLTATDPEGDTISWRVKGGTTLPSGITFSNAGMMVIAKNGGDTSGIAVDGKGSVYVNGKHTVIKYNSNGEHLAEIGGNLLYPRGVTVDGNGSIYVADTGHGAVKKYSFDGNFITNIASGLPSPYGVAVDGNGSIYVADRHFRTVNKYNPEGDFITRIHTSTCMQYAPIGVTVDRSDNIYIAEPCMGVKKYDSIGRTLIEITDRFSPPVDVAVDEHGNIYVADVGNNAVKKYNSKGGSPITIWRGLSSPIAVAVDKNGNIYVTDREGIKKYSQNASLNGTATTAGEFNITLVATDAKGLSSEHTFTLKVKVSLSKLETGLTSSFNALPSSADGLNTYTATITGSDAASGGTQKLTTNGVTSTSVNDNGSAVEIHTNGGSSSSTVQFNKNGTVELSSSTTTSSGDNKVTLSSRNSNVAVDVKDDGSKTMSQTDGDTKVDIAINKDNEVSLSFEVNGETKTFSFKGSSDIKVEVVDGQVVVTSTDKNLIVTSGSGGNKVELSSGKLVFSSSGVKDTLLNNTDSTKSAASTSSARALQFRNEDFNQQVIEGIFTLEKGGVITIGAE